MHNLSRYTASLLNLWKPSLIVFLGAEIISTAWGQTPYNNQHSFWPMAVGSKWVFRISSDTQEPYDPSVVGAASVFTVQTSPAHFGCSVFTNESVDANDPWEIDLAKVHPGAYWQPTLTQNLRWFLGVSPITQSGSGGALFQLGWIAYDYNDYDSIADTKDLVPIGPSSLRPYAQLMKGAHGGDSSVEYADYVSPMQDVMGCATGAPQFAGRKWIPTWTPVRALVVPAGRFENVVESRYIEQGGGADTNREIWYFAKNVGPIKIEATDSNWNPVIVLDLVSWQLGNGSPVPSSVTLRDALMTKAGTTQALPFGQWADAFSQVTNLNAPTAAQSCTNDKDMTLDEYLATLEQVGSATCDVVQYPTTYNGESADDMLVQMNRLAGTPSGYVYDWDQWAYYYWKIEGQPAPSPDTECMKTYTHPHAPSVVAYNRYLLLTPRQWLLFFENMFFGCAG